MRIRAPLDLGLIIRARRRKLGLSQSALAEKVGVGRQWLVGVEHGKARAEVGLVLRTLAALHLELSAYGIGQDPSIESAGQIPSAPIDDVVWTQKKGNP